MESIEKKVTDAILQRASLSIEIEGREYPIAPATPATLILVSELIAEMPEVRSNVDNILFETLRTARDCKVVGKIVATLILGAKRIKENRSLTIEKESSSRRFSWRKLRFINEVKKDIGVVSELEYLSTLILENCSPAAIGQVVSQRLMDMGLSDFFGLTTSLSEANLLKSTKEVEATQFGE